MKELVVAMLLMVGFVGTVSADSSERAACLEKKKEWRCSTFKDSEGGTITICRCVN